MKAVELDGTGSTPPSGHVHPVATANALALIANTARLFRRLAPKQT